MTHVPASDIRPAGVAGTFYPSSADRLASTVDRLLKDPPGAGVRALVAPHAGYPFSGAVAGEAFSQVRPGEVEALVLVGPSHLESFDGITLFPGSAYRTPLGDCPVHTGIAGALLRDRSSGVRESLAGHWQQGHPRQEHALEVELPFLQRRLRAVPCIVPLVIGEVTWPEVEGLGRAIAAAVSAGCDPGRVVLIASSDLSHFHPASAAEERDRRTLELIGAFDPGRFYEALRLREAEACGGAAIAAVQVAAGLLGASEAVTVTYRHSGTVTGQMDEVVGYGAVRIS